MVSMKLRTALLLLLILPAAIAFAEDPKPAAKKSEKPAAKSDKNVFQKTESSVGKFMRDNKIWTKSEPRGSLDKKPAKKKPAD
jgi:hypothetical protein